MAMKKEVHKPFKKFEAIDPNSVAYVATTYGGHTAGISEDAVEVHPTLHKLAILNGATDEGNRERAAAQFEADRPPENNMNKERPEIIYDAVSKVMKRAMEGGEPNLITGDGRPTTGAVSDVAGFPVTAAERDKAWEEFQQEGE